MGLQLHAAPRGKRLLWPRCEICSRALFLLLLLLLKHILGWIWPACCSARPLPALLLLEL